MPMHDWSQVKAGTYHNFHVLWISNITNRLNAGLLPLICQTCHYSSTTNSTLTCRWKRHIRTHGMLCPSMFGGCLIRVSVPKTPLV